MSPDSVRVRVTVTVERNGRRASASSESTATDDNFAVGEACDFASREAARRTRKLFALVAWKAAP